MHHRIKKIALSVVLLSVCWLVAENFVAKKKKTVSVATLKNDCGQKCGDLLKLSTQVVKEMAVFQETLLDQVYEIIEGNADSFFAQNDKQELQKCLSTMNAFEERLVTMHKHLKEHVIYIKTLKS